MGRKSASSRRVLVAEDRKQKFHPNNNWPGAFSKSLMTEFQMQLESNVRIENNKSRSSSSPPRSSPSPPLAPATATNATSITVTLPTTTAAPAPASKMKDFLEKKSKYTSMLSSSQNLVIDGKKSQINPGSVLVSPASSSGSPSVSVVNDPFISPVPSSRESVNTPTRKLVKFSPHSYFSPSSTTDDGMGLGGMTPLEQYQRTISQARSVQLLSPSYSTLWKQSPQRQQQRRRSKTALGLPTLSIAQEFAISLEHQQQEQQEFERRQKLQEEQQQRRRGSFFNVSLRRSNSMTSVGSNASSSAVTAASSGQASSANSATMNLSAEAAYEEWWEESDPCPQYLKMKESPIKNQKGNVPHWAFFMLQKGCPNEEVDLPSEAAHAERRRDEDFFDRRRLIQMTLDEIINEIGLPEDTAIDVLIERIIQENRRRTRKIWPDSSSPLASPKGPLPPPKCSDEYLKVYQKKPVRHPSMFPDSVFRSMLPGLLQGLAPLKKEKSDEGGTEDEQVKKSRSFLEEKKSSPVQKVRPSTLGRKHRTEVISFLQDRWKQGLVLGSREKPIFETTSKQKLEQVLMPPERYGRIVGAKHNVCMRCSHQCHLCLDCAEILFSGKSEFCEECWDEMLRILNE